MKYKLTKAEQETVINFDNELDAEYEALDLYPDE